MLFALRILDEFGDISRVQRLGFQHSAKASVHALGSDYYDKSLCHD